MCFFFFCFLGGGGGGGEESEIRVLRSANSTLQSAFKSSKRSALLSKGHSPKSCQRSR